MQNRFMQGCWAKLVGCVLTVLSGSMLCTSEAAEAVSVAEWRALGSDYFGQNADLANAGSWRDSRYVESFKKLNAQHVRFPAGTIANYWDWKKGWIYEGSAAPYGLDKAKPNYYYLSDLKLLYDETATAPIFVLNLLTSTLPYQLEMLQEAERLGLPVKYVELGNEFYLSKSDNVERFPTCEDYAAMANEWAVAVKAAFPEVKVSAVGAAVRATDNARRKSWNQTLFPLLRNVDAVSIHIYAGAELFYGAGHILEEAGLVAGDKRSKRKASDGRPGYWALDKEQELQLERLHTEWGTSRMLGMPSQRWSQVEDFEGLPEGMEVWVSEYGLFDRTGPIRHTWANGMFVASFSLHALDFPQVSKMTYHCTFNHPMFAAIYGEKDAFSFLVEDKLIPEKPVSAPFNLTPSGVALCLIGKASEAMDEVAGLIFSENQKITEGEVVPYDALYGKAFRRGERLRCVVLNRSDKAKLIDLDPIFPEGCSVQAFTMSSPLAYGCSEADYQHSSKSFKRANAVRLPAFSIAVMEF